MRLWKAQSELSGLGISNPRVGKSEPVPRTRRRCSAALVVGTGYIRTHALPRCFRGVCETRGYLVYPRGPASSSNLLVPRESSTAQRPIDGAARFREVEWGGGGREEEEEEEGAALSSPAPMQPAPARCSPACAHRCPVHAHIRAVVVARVCARACRCSHPSVPHACHCCSRAHPPVRGHRPHVCPCARREGKEGEGEGGGGEEGEWAACESPSHPSVCARGRPQPSGTRARR